MTHASFFTAALLVQNWFERKKIVLTDKANSHKKTVDFVTHHSCVLIHLPCGLSQMKTLVAKRSSSKRATFQKMHTFASSSDPSLHSLISSSESQEDSGSSCQNFVAKKMINQPFKEHTVATEWLELILNRPHSTHPHHHTIFSMTVSQENKSSQEWIIKREEERQFQICRVIGYLVNTV